MEAVHQLGRTWNIEEYGQSHKLSQIRVDMDQIVGWAQDVIRLKIGKDIGLFRVDLNKFKDALIGIPTAALDDLTNYLINTSRTQAGK